MNGFHEFWAGAADADRSGRGCVAALCGEVSRTSQGSLFFASACLVLSTEIPFTPWLPIETGVSVLGAGVSVLDAGLLPSSRTNASTALSKLPFTFFSTSEFRRLSLNPISLSVASF